jgi:hypothetical protein
MAAARGIIIDHGMANRLVASIAAAHSGDFGTRDRPNSFSERT